MAFDGSLQLHLPLGKEGFFERLVGLVKRSLRKEIGAKRLTLDQFVVILAEVEAVVNTRPLGHHYCEATGESAPKGKALTVLFTII